MSSLKYKVLRGGCWLGDPVRCRSASRYFRNPAYPKYFFGFRVSLFNETTMKSDLLPNLKMIKIPAGSFVMGSPADERGRFDDEGPQHKVTLESFALSSTPITQAQWREVARWKERPGERWNLRMKQNPSYFKDDNRPVESVSWHEAMEFCSRLSQRTGQTYTLPSEAQWEYACRAGTNTPFYCGNTLSNKDANFNAKATYEKSSPGLYIGKTTEVGIYPPNPWGLYDMHGNVWEWCLDDWHDNYEGAPADGSAWVMDNGLGKSLGGGSWVNPAVRCRSASRKYRYLPADGLSIFGLRICAS